MQSLKIILLCVAAAVVYGICHDQVTARVCVEYFTVGHKRIFPTESPTLLALGFGIVATWWVGAILGVAAALACRAGSWPKLEVGHLTRPLACLLTVMAVASILALVTGYQLGQGGGFVLPEPLGSRVAEDRHHLFFADSLAHLAAYGVGVIGGTMICVVALLRRCRAARAAASADDETTPIDLLTEPWLLVACRWTARTTSLPLLVLLVLLTMGDGVPNPVTASSRERLFLVVVLMLLVGLVLAWKREGVGSLLILGGLVLFAASGEVFLLKIVVAPWLVTGLCYLVCWAGARNRAFTFFPKKVECPLF